MVKNPPAMQQTQVQSLGIFLIPCEGNGCPLQCSCLENSMDRGSWPGTVHGVAEWDNTERLSAWPSTMNYRLVLHLSGILLKSTVQGFCCAPGVEEFSLVSQAKTHSFGRVLSVTHSCSINSHGLGGLVQTSWIHFPFLYRVFFFKLCYHFSFTTFCPVWMWCWTTASVT